MHLGKLIRGIVSVVATVVLGAMGMMSYYSYALPDSYRVFYGEDLQTNFPGVSAAASGEVAVGKNFGQTSQVDLMLFGMIPIKSAQVQELQEQMLIPCGTPFGVKLLTDGVMVVAVNDVDTAEGKQNPARKAGLEVGDVVVSLDGAPVSTNQQVGKMVADSNGEPISVCYRRDGKESTTTLVPAKSSSGGQWRAGLWVRDSSAGIGTVTFCTGDGVFGGLGHPICDVDTGEILPLASGEIVEATITGVKKGACGAAGELCGNFSNNDNLGNVELNTECGLFGKLNEPLTTHDAVPLGLKQDVQPGKATIYTTLSGEEPQEYDVEIESIDYHDNTRNLIVKVTDPELLEKTGGIVQGMSGSPILQNGKLVGAVTHVLVNDPTKGFGIFAETMFETSKQVSDQTQSS